MTKALMFQGTGSDVGKSLIVAGLCRALVHRGYRVKPFKPQNMSNNAAVTAEGGEIGRAQALQARACKIAPSVHMNPVLLKPSSEVGAQIVIQGRVAGHARARDYLALKAKMMGYVLESFGKVSADADFVFVEGAGSASEVNLRQADIANMGFARAADVPVVLIGDIDRGGVIAQIVGTKAVIDAADADCIKAFMVNKFRGDPSLFDEGMRAIERQTSWPGLGLIPWFAQASRLPAEDAVALAQPLAPANVARVKIAVPWMPCIANFDDFDPLKAEAGVTLVMVQPGEPLPVCDLVILPGSKATIADLAFLRAQGWDIDIYAHARRGGRVLGICGGYQMLGRRIADPDGHEGPPGEVVGLGLLEVETLLTAEKVLRDCAGVSVADGAPFSGYEMHMGFTSGPDCARPLLRMRDGRPEGAVSARGRVSGAYVHGLFGNDAQRAAWLKELGAPSSGLHYEHEIERVLDAWAAHLERHVQVDRLISLAS
jgi:adenosylcobyric acid synthase